MKEKDIINNNNIYKKIENYESNRNNNYINQLLNNKEKDNNLQPNKQKNIFLNNNIGKYNHVSRIINLKSLNGHNNNNLNGIKDSFFSKYNKGINQNNKQIKDPYKKEQKCISAFDTMLTNNRNNS